MVRADGYVVRELCLVDCFEDGQALSDGCDTDGLEGLWIQQAKDVAGNVVFCGGGGGGRGGEDEDGVG